jgi:DNA-binding MarR family transcriptional regulator
MAKTSAADTTRLWEGLTRAHNLMTAALEKDLVPQAGIPLAWYEVLHHLTEAPGGLLRFQELAKVSGISDSGASRRLDQMIKAGLIDRQSCPTDRRGVYAHITEQGRATHKRAHTVLVRSLTKNRELLQGVSLPT